MLPAPSSLAGWGPGAVCPRSQTRVLGSGPPPPAWYPSPLYSLVSTRIILVDGLGKVIYGWGDENTLASYFQNTLPVPKEFCRALRVSREKTGGAVPPSHTGSGGWHLTHRGWGALVRWLRSHPSLHARGSLHRRRPHGHTVAGEADTNKGHRPGTHHCETPGPSP